MILFRDISLLTVAVTAGLGLLPTVHAQQAQREAVALQDTRDRSTEAQRHQGRLKSAAADSASPRAATDVAVPEQEILLLAPRSTPWTVSTSGQWSWETNPGFGAVSEISSSVYLQSATARYSKTVAEEWLTDISLQGMLFRYDRLPGLDFDRVAARANVSWLGTSQWENPLWAGWVPTAGVDWFRLNDAGRWSEALFDNTFASLGVWRTFTLTSQQVLFISLNSSWSVDASVLANQRDEYSLTAAWLTRWAPRWESTVFARAAYYDVTTRDDGNFSMGVSLDYVWPNSNLRAGLTAMATLNESTSDVFDYQTASVGVSFSLKHSF